MLHLVDASVLIEAKDCYHEFDRVPEFREWILNRARTGLVKIPQEICDELLKGKDPLTKWMNRNRTELLLDEEVDESTLNEVLNRGYGPKLTSVEVESIGTDAILISHAFKSRTCRTVVTREKPSRKKRQNRRIPDVCKDLEATCCDPWELNRALDFRTDRKTRQSGDRGEQIRTSWSDSISFCAESDDIVPVSFSSTFCMNHLMTRQIGDDHLLHQAWLKDVRNPGGSGQGCRFSSKIDCLLDNSACH